MRDSLQRFPAFMVLVAALAAFSATAAAEKAPDFTFRHNNKPVKLSSLKGRVVYLDFWASWCEPCRKSFPWMNEMHKRYGGDGLVVIGVNLDQERSEAARFLASTPARFDIVYDAEGKLAERYNVTAMPSSYLIDRHGNIVTRKLGFKMKDKPVLEGKIRSLLNQNQRASTK